MDKTLYLTFNGKDFTDFISFVKSMSSRDKTKFSRVVSLHIENGKLVCRSIDDAFNLIEYYVGLCEGDNTIIEPCAASVSDLYALVKSSADTDKFIIRKAFGQYEFKVVGGGWMPFRTSNCDLTKFEVKCTIEDIGAVNSVKLRNAISTVLGYTQEYTYARDKFIRFSKSQMTVTSRLSGVVIADKFVDMTLHRDDAAMLKSLLKDNFDLIISRVTGDTAKKIMFAGPKFKFVTIENSIDQSNVTYLDNITDYITVDCNELYKLVVFAEEYSASKHVIGISVKNKELNVSIKNVLAAKHCSTVKSTQVGNVEDTEKEYEVPSHSLLKSLKLFQDKHCRDLHIYINDKMVSSQNNILIFDDSTQAIINIYNR